MSASKKYDISRESCLTVILRLHSEQKMEILFHEWFCALFSFLSLVLIFILRRITKRLSFISLRWCLKVFTEKSWWTYEDIVII